MDQHDKAPIVAGRTNPPSELGITPQPPAPRHADELTVLGAILLVVWVLISAAWFRRGGWTQLIWLCDVATLLTAIGLLLHSRLLLTAQFIGMVLYHLAWHIDMLAYVLFGSMPLLSTAYMFSGELTAYEKALSFFQHTYLIPVSAWALWCLGSSRRAWVFQTVQTMAVFLATYFFTSPSANINWIFGAGFADLSPARTNPAVYYTVMALATALLVYLPANLLLNRLLPRKCDSIRYRAKRARRVALALGFASLLAAISMWVGHVCDVTAEVPKALVEGSAHGPLALELIPETPDAPRVSTVCYGRPGEEVEIPHLAINRPLPRLRDANGQLGPVRLSELLSSCSAADIPSAPQAIVLRGYRERLGTVLAAFVISDRPYLQSYFDLQTALSRFELHCQLGREGIEEFLGQDPARQDQPVNRISNGTGTVGLYAVTLVAFENQQPVARSPFYLFRRTGVYHPEDIEWRSDESGSSFRAHMTGIRYRK